MTIKTRANKAGEEKELIGRDGKYDFKSMEAKKAPIGGPIVNPTEKAIPTRA